MASVVFWHLSAKPKATEEEKNVWTERKVTQLKFQYKKVSYTLNMEKINTDEWMANTWMQWTVGRAGTFCN